MPERILIYRLGSLGDTVISLPCFHLIARTFPNAERYVLTNLPVNNKAAPLWTILGKTGLVHGYFNYPLNTRNPTALMKLRIHIISWKPDILIYLAAPRGTIKIMRDMFFFRFCGIRRLLGVPLSKELSTHRLDHVTGLFEYEASRLARCLSVLGDAALNDKRSWDLHISPTEEDTVDKALMSWSGRTRFISCSPGTKMSAKDWGIENWNELLSRLSIKYTEVGIAFIGSQDESARCEVLHQIWKGPSINLCGRLSPRESAALIRRSVLFLGHDSGPMHLSYAVGTPCVAIFSARNKPGVWFPYGYEEKNEVIYHKTECYGCNLEVCTQHKKKCITSISIDEVLEAVESLREQCQLF